MSSPHSTKKNTSEFWITHILSINSFSLNAFGKSTLFPRTRTYKQNIILSTTKQSITGIPANCGFSNNWCSSFFAASNFSWSAASTIKLQQQCRINRIQQVLEYLHYCCNSSTVAFPHWPKSWLSSNVPQLKLHAADLRNEQYKHNLNSNISFGDLPHVKPNSWNHVFIELTTLQIKQWCALKRITKL